MKGSIHCIGMPTNAPMSWLIGVLVKYAIDGFESADIIRNTTQARLVYRRLVSVALAIAPDKGTKNSSAPLADQACHVSKKESV